MKKFVMFCAAALMALTMMACGGSEAKETTAEVTTTAAPTEAAIYVAGTYTGEGRGFGGKVTVTITVDATSITAVEITHKNETAGMGGKEGIEDGTYADQIIAANGGEIEGVTRASFTTKAVKAAYAAALEQALVSAQ